MKLARLVLVVAIIFGSAAWLHAQMPPNLENGFKNWGSYDSTKLDTVNTLNGNQMLRRRPSTQTPVRWLRPARRAQWLL
jgi:hypothetical protein